jgi:hypothetical protein
MGGHTQQQLSEWYDLTQGVIGAIINRKTC